MDDVASAAGVSRSLVSLVFQDSPKVSDRSRAKVIKAAERLGYRPNPIARSLASKTNRTLGVLLNDISNPYFSQVYASIAAAATARGYRLLLGVGERSAEREAESIDELLDHRVAALILVSPRLPSVALARAVASTPTAVIGRQVRGAHVDSIVNDEIHGARLAIGHLVDLGHQGIAHISGGQGAGAADRAAAYEQAMRENGLSRHIRVVPGDFTEAAGEAGASTLLTGANRRAQPTAVLAANDLVAVGLIAAAARLGLEVPSDLAVVGYDDLPLSALSMISLTTIAQPLADFGPAAVGLVLDRVEGEASRRRARIRTFEPSLIVRTTTALRTT